MSLTTLLPEIQTRIEATLATAGITGYVVTRGEMPNSPNKVITLQRYAGKAPLLHFGSAGLQYEYPSLRVSVRGEPTDYEAPLAVMNTLYRDLVTIQNELLPGTGLAQSRYLMVKATQQPVLQARDGNQRCVWTCNFAIDRDFYTDDAVTPILEQAFGYYKLEESIDPWVDSIGNFPNLTQAGDPVVSATGINNDAASFPGGAFLASADHPSWDFRPDGFTFNMWINMAAGGHIQFHHTNQSTGWGLSEVGGGVSLWTVWDSVSGSSSVNTPAITSSVWHMLTVGFDVSINKAFLYFDNGTRSIGNALANGISNYTGVFRLGNFPGGTYAGLIDEWGIWSRTLTDAEVSELWAGGSGLFL